ncbi:MULTISPECIES: molybdopterin biosynthesis protein [Anaerolinea]|uniref:molybdopterin biosynthesis protein n=1 Tax=Anaerolinea TaxID=233189 RepID=UPI00260BDDAB|nr:molybdopterin biosynthesis protein [Anaerolinea thermophila]
MSVYLHDIPLPEAQQRFTQALAGAGMDGFLGKEEIPLDEQALGRVLAEPVWARLSSPHYHAAAMDGFALRAEATAGASPTRPVTLQVSEQAVYVDTGDPLPDWANAVVPIENVEALDDHGMPASDPRHPLSIRLREALPPWTHVRPMGEDIVATELVLPAGHILRPVDLGAIAASGHTSVWVARLPRVAILPTGTELIPIGQPVRRGDIIEYNSLVLAAQVRSWGGEAVRFPITPDNFEQICQQVQKAADTCDLVLLNAGSSAGSEDFSARVVEQLGTLLVHGVAVRPGHPVILGLIRRSQGGWTPMIGVPGYPVSAALTGEIFVEPLLARWLGRRPAEPLEIEARITRKVTSPAGDDDYMRVVVGKVGDRVLAAPLSRGAGVITSLVRADGIVILPRGVQGVEAGTPVKVRLYRSPAEVEQTIFAIGSHDLTLDVLAQALASRKRRLVSANVGSLGGLVALRRGEAHLAGSHLLDPQTGEFNLPYIRQYLPETPVTLVEWVGRIQGLLVKKGNPLQIHGLEDLTRPEVRFVNRQRGAGTRVLLDYHLERLGIDPAQVQGYDQEEYTHLAVAAAVASGRADCGLGVMAAAQALDLDFIPLFTERYQLVIPTVYYESELLRPLRDLMQDETFRRSVQGLPGYTVENMGQIVAQLL